MWASVEMFDFGAIDFIHIHVDFLNPSASKAQVSWKLLLDPPQSYVRASPVCDLTLRRDPGLGSGSELSRSQQQHSGSSRQQPQARDAGWLRQLAGSSTGLQQR